MIPVKVVVAIYTHEYGRDVRAFETLNQARQWKDDIGRNRWNEEFPDEPWPPEDIGNEYFNRMAEFDRGEYFEVETCDMEYR